MIQRIGATLNTSTGEIEYKTTLPTIYQGSESSYWLDVDFAPALSDANAVFITFRRSDGATTAELNMTSADGKVWSKLLEGDWFFYKSGQLKFTVTVLKINGTAPNQTRQILASSYNYLAIQPTIAFNQPAPLAPNDYELLSSRINTTEGDIDALEDRVGALDNEDTGRVTIAEEDIDAIEEANPVTGLDGFNATTSHITFNENHLNGNQVQKTIDFPSDFATEGEAQSIAINAVNYYNTNTVQPKFNEIDDTLSTSVHYDSLQDDTEQIAISVTKADEATRVLTIAIDAQTPRYYYEQNAIYSDTGSYGSTFLCKSDGIVHAIDITTSTTNRYCNFLLNRGNILTKLTNTSGYEKDITFDVELFQYDNPHQVTTQQGRVKCVGSTNSYLVISLEVHNGNSYRQVATLYNSIDGWIDNGTSTYLDLMKYISLVNNSVLKVARVYNFALTNAYQQYETNLENCFYYGNRFSLTKLQTGTDLNSWRAIKVNGIQKLDNSISGNPLDLVAGNNISLSESNGAVTVAMNHLYKHHIVGKVSANEFRFEVYSTVATPVTSLQDLITVLGTDYANWNCIPTHGDNTLVSAGTEVHGNFVLPYNMKIENDKLNIYYLKLSQVSGASTDLTWETASTPLYIESFDSDTVYQVI